MNPADKSLICLCSEPNFLAVNILENLIANNCYVNVVTTDTHGWLEKTSNISTRNKFGIVGYKSFQKSINYNYVIYCSGFLDKNNAASDIKKFLSLVNYKNKKTLFIFPKEIYGVLNVTPSDTSDSVGVIYVGDLLGPRIDLESDLKLPTLLNQIISGRVLTISSNEVINPLFVSDAAKQIIKWLFAFGPFGKETILLGPDTSPSVFWQANSKLVGEIKFNAVSDDTTNNIPKNIEKYKINKDLNYCLTETYKWLSLKPVKYVKQKPANTIKVKKAPSPKNQQTSRRDKKFRKVITYLLIVLIIPIITLVAGGGLLYFSLQQFRLGHDKASLALVNGGKVFLNVGYYESIFLKNIPLIGQLYKETEYISSSLLSASTIALDAVPLARTGGNLVNNVLGNSPYSAVELLGESDERLQRIYSNLLEIEGKTTTASVDNSLAARYVSSKINFENYKKLVSQIMVIASKLPDILGDIENKTYLVLFENNMELRPTGGFIGSYGLITFDDGRLSDFTISDVYSADGQLNGHVEPPIPIKEYLGEANWWLRDSNWDPDFPTSAKRAEWFLDKEINKQVDGVVSIDLNPIKDFLKVSGPIYLYDYSVEITSDNLYEKVQSEVQDNFFPGTHKKATFLTALSRSLISELGDLSSSQKTSILKLAYTNLEERHAQVFLHDSEFQDAINNLNWAGSVFIPKCEGNCYSDLVGIVEANLGVNKSNYFISREADMDISIGEGKINRVLTLTLHNSANKNLGVSGRYKSYVRLLVPENSTDIKVESISGQNVDLITPNVTNSKGRKEIGGIIEILGGESKKIVFSWASDYSGPLDLYGLYLRKQAGVEGYPVNISVKALEKPSESSPVFTLTDQGKYDYNTTLARDLFVKLSF